METQNTKQQSSFFTPKEAGSMVSKEDVARFSEGVHYDLYNLLGAHRKTINNIEGFLFTLWAPNAESVFLRGEFLKSPTLMKKTHGGIFETFVPRAKEGDVYDYEIVTKEGTRQVKTDPYGNYFCKRPEFSSRVFEIDKYEFRDHKWMSKRKKVSLNTPMNIYEVHLGSWKKSIQDYRSLAHAIVEYVLMMGYTHVEILPVAEHPLDESWGYQVTGFFAPTSRFGSPREFQYFVDYLHLNGIGVILDWVGAHFPLDKFSLSKFDGTPLYEHDDPLKGFHPVWNTAMFDYSKPEVCNFLIASVLFFLDKFHIDCVRLDAVSSMIYLDHERTNYQWKANREGGNLNLEAIAFIRHLNEIVHLKHPDVLTIAEESTPFKGVTHPVDEGGLGFDLKWNMGWMNDTLKYFEKKPEYRTNLYDQICFSHTYSFSEKFLLPLSHDEVVHEKKSLFSKMPSSLPMQQLKLMLTYQYCHPGKKLIFMGQELSQKTEWDSKDEISWDLLEEPEHFSFQSFIKELNDFYKNHSALYERDFSDEGFEWQHSDKEHSVIGFFRKSEKETLLCFFHFSEGNVSVPIPEKTKLTLLFTSNQKSADSIINKEDGVMLLPSLSATIFGVHFDKRDNGSEGIS